MVTKTIKQFDRPVSEIRRQPRYTTKVPKISQTTISQKPVDRVAELKAQGYTQEGNKLYSPKEQYLTYWTTSGERQYDSYSKKVYEVDSQGRIVKEITQETKIVEASSTGAWTDRDVVQSEIKSYDYDKGVVTTTRPDTRQETFLGIAQTTPQTPIQEEKLPEYIEVGEKRYGVTGPKTLAFAQRKAEELKAQQVEVQKPTPVKDELITVEAGQVPVSAALYNKIISEMYSGAPYRKLKEGEIGLIKVDSPKIEVAKDVRSSLSSGKSVVLSSLERDIRILGVQGPKEKEEVSKLEVAKKFGEGLIEPFVSPVKGAGKILLSQQQALQRTIFPEQVSFIGSPTTGMEIVKGTEGKPSFTKFIAESGRDKRLIRDPDIQSAILIAGLAPLAAASPYARAAISGTMIGSGIVETKEGLKEMDPFRTGAGISIGLLGLTGVGDMLKVRRTPEAFLKSLEAEPLRGKTYYGEKVNVEVIKGGLTKRTPELSVTEPKVIPIEERIVRTPERTLTTIKGEQSFGTITPEGTQRITVKGTGRYKDFFLRTTTTPEGVSVSTVYKADKPLKTFEFISEESILFTERKLVGKTRDVIKPDIDPNLPQEVLTPEFRTEIKTSLSKSEGIPTSREKPFTGEIYAAGKEVLNVETLVPRMETVIDPKTKTLTAETVRTQFEFTDYPVTPEESIINLKETGEVFGTKPVEFQTVQDYRVGEIFEIKPTKLGKPKRISPEFVKEQTKLKVDFESMAKPKEPAKRFFAEQAETLDVQSTKMVSDLMSDLTKYDPFGLSGDRLRAVTTQEQITMVQRPASPKLTVPELRIFTEITPSVTPTTITPPLTLTQPKVETTVLPDTRLSITPSASLTNVQDTFTELASVQTPISEVVTRERTITELASVQTPVSETLIETPTETLSQTQVFTLTETLSQLQTPTIGLPFVGIPPTGIPRMKKLKGIKEKQEVFDVFVRESAPKGQAPVKEVRVNTKPLPINAALNKGDEYVDESSARSFRLKKRGKRSVDDEPQFFDDYKYRKVKGKTELEPDFYVEKSAYAIDSFGERMEITAKGLKKKKAEGKRYNKMLGGLI